MSGYSKTPLVKKLGLKEGFAIYTLHEPPNYFELLDPFPDSIIISSEISEESIDFVHLFAKDLEVLEEEIYLARNCLKKNGMLWISWPKGSSGTQTNLNGNIVRAVGLSVGLVDIKVCAIDEKWSGLKFVYRTKDR